jgi:hypothetical protein
VSGFLQKLRAWATLLVGFAVFLCALAAMAFVAFAGLVLIFCLFAGVSAFALLKGRKPGSGGPVVVQWSTNFGPGRPIFTNDLPTEAFPPTREGAPVELYGPNGELLRPPGPRG